MTLRFEGHQPVGLDWSACTDGTSRPEVWQELPTRKAKAEVDPLAPIRPSTQRMSSAMEARVIRLYRDEQLSAIEVGKVVGCQPATVFKVLKRHNVPSRSRQEGMAISRAKRTA